MADWQSMRRTLGPYLLFLAPCAVLAVSVLWIVKDEQRLRESTAAASGAVLAPPAPPPAAASAAPSSVPPLDSAESAPAQFLDETDDGEPKAATKTPPKRYATVHQAALESCSTESVEGLSRQIIEQARCVSPSSVVSLPKRPNL